MPVGKAATGAALNRSRFTLPEDGWIMGIPKGEFEGVLVSTGEDGTESRKDILQVFDEEALAAMLKRFETEKAADNWGGMLVDIDHFSHMSDQRSEAAGWIDAMELRADGLWVQPRWTEMGLPLIEGGNYRFVSPVLTDLVEIGENRWRPARFERLALTNDPKLKGMPPITNRQTTNKQTENTMDYKKLICSLLGLPDTATDQDITAAAGELAKSRQAANDAANSAAVQLRNRVTTLETELKAATDQKATFLAELIERDAALYGGRVADAVALKAQLLANREGTLATLKLLGIGDPSKGGKPPTHDSKNRQNPGNPDTDGKRTDPALSRKIAARAGQLCDSTPGMSLNRAWQIARSELVPAS